MDLKKNSLGDTIIQLYTYLSKKCETQIKGIY